MRGGSDGKRVNGPMVMTTKMKVNINDEVMRHDETVHSDVNLTNHCSDGDDDTVSACVSWYC